jgi:DNA mismatch endonuclease, patch repair protein
MSHRRHTPLAPAPPPSSPAAKVVMRANRGIDTAPELALRRAVHARGLRYQKHVAPVAGLRCKADLLFSAARVAVFVDGCFWHRCPQHGELPKANRAWWKDKLARTWDRDRANDFALDAAGWTVVRVWEHEAPDEAAARVFSAVAGSRNYAPHR